MVYVNVPVHHLNVRLKTLVVTMIHSNVATVNVSHGTSFVIKTKIVTMVPMRKTALPVDVQRKHSNVMMVLAFHDLPCAMDVGNVQMVLTKLVVTKELLVMKNPSAVNQDNVYHSIPFVMQSLTASMAQMKLMPSVNTVSISMNDCTRCSKKQFISNCKSNVNLVSVSDTYTFAQPLVVIWIPC